MSPSQRGSHMADIILTYFIAYLILWIHTDGWGEMGWALPITWGLITAILWWGPAAQTAN